MKSISDHEYFVQLYVDGDRLRSIGQIPVGQIPVGRDRWSPALECLRLAAARRDRRQPPLLPIGPVTVQPMWHAELGEPYIRAVRVEVAANGDSTAGEFAIDYFAEDAEQLTRSLRESGKLDAATACRYLVCAFPRQAHPGESQLEPASRWSVTPREQPLVLHEESMDVLLRGSELCGHLVDDDLPVFIPNHVLDEAVLLHEQAGAAETGGNLIGHLCRDTCQPDRLFARVTAQVPARHAQRELTSLTFTAETWANVDGVIRLRGGRERKLGWWHSHPARRWCEKCPVESRKVCKISGEFFSQHDAVLHRAAYPMAFSVALVISDSYADGLTLPSFGWRRGVLARRGFHRLLETPSAGVRT